MQRRDGCECHFTLVTGRVGIRCAGASSNLTDRGDVYPVWEVFNTVPHDELGGTVNIMQIFLSDVLGTCQEPTGYDSDISVDILVA